MSQAVATNQVMTADTTASTLYSPPVAMGGNDTVFAVLTVHFIHGTAADLTVTAEVSNDGGVTWVSATQFTSMTLSAAGSADEGPSVVSGGWVRFKYVFGNISSGTGGIGFDLNVRLDHS